MHNYLFYREPNEGNLEYKLNLSNFTSNKYEKYSTQLKYRVLEGRGEAIYIIGVFDNGEIKGIPIKEFNITIDKFNHICMNVNCSIKLIMKCRYNQKKFLILKAVANFDLNSLPFIF